MLTQTSIVSALLMALALADNLDMDIDSLSLKGGHSSRSHRTAGGGGTTSGSKNTKGTPWFLIGLIGLVVIGAVIYAIVEA